MDWSEIANGDWTLPAARNKTAQDFVRPISGPAQAVLAALPRRGVWVFTAAAQPHLVGFLCLSRISTPPAALPAGHSTIYVALRDPS